MNSIITRFAPSPTGNLHIGGVRTALLNYIVTEQAKKKFPNSKFLLRIEDTDKIRSTEEFQNSIINGLKWLDINYDQKPYIQSTKIKRHQEIANELIQNKKAFKCICSNEILEKKRNENRKNKINDKKLCKSCESNTKIQSLKDDYTIRIKIPNTGETYINDIIQGKITVQNREIDDFVLLRRDGTPTYMLSVVVDDYDMDVNLIIRGDDHLNNVFRQNFIYTNMDWQKPNYAHLPLIHGEDGKKLSKRHGAVNIIDFKEKGYLTNSIINNLILLGWGSQKVDEFITMDEIINLFEINKLSKSSSIFSYDKLNYFNQYFINKDSKFEELLNYCSHNTILNKFIESDKEKFLRLFFVYKKKLQFYKQLEYICPIYYNENKKIITNDLLSKKFNQLMKKFLPILENLNAWKIENLENLISKFITKQNIKFIEFGKPSRIIFIHKENGPSISDILYIFGKKNSILIIKNYISKL